MIKKLGNRLVEQWKIPAQRRRILLSGIPVVLCMAGIFFFSAQNALESDQSSLGATQMLLGILQKFGVFTGVIAGSEAFREFHAHLREAAHFTEYLIFGICAFGFFRRFTSGKTLESIAVPFVFCAFYAVTDEIHQFFVPGRAMQFVDWAVDSAGVLSAVLIARWIESILKKRRKQKAI